VVYGGLPIPESADAKSPHWWIDSAVLIDAMRVAQRFACRKVVFPAQVGNDFKVIGPIVERATLISGLIGANDSVDAIVVDMPLLDLKDEQIVELADDCAAQMKLFWPCEQADLTPCGECTGCKRWRSAFELAGPGWPWEVAESSQVAVA
jgi:hypothetical protein